MNTGCWTCKTWRDDKRGDKKTRQDIKDIKAWLWSINRSIACNCWVNNVSYLAFISLVRYNKQETMQACTEASEGGHFRLPNWLFSTIHFSAPQLHTQKSEQSFLCSLHDTGLPLVSLLQLLLIGGRTDRGRSTWASTPIIPKNCWNTAESIFPQTYSAFSSQSVLPRSVMG